ncbi:SDR family oxidoreductase [Olivibacter sitiensis]|uniref:SDR family oxidoreductase n=1 Tax=Olivibacter sitiensis TaxID=376470 RepID=UPI0003F9D847|nr:SDR family oxidoreductase [Olivibacter sitiensis]
MAKILITGATGGLGSAVVESLKEKISAGDIAVLVRDGHSDKAEQYRKEGFDVRVADYDHVEALATAFVGIDVLYFVSGNDIHARLAQHRNVVTAAKESGIKHILYTSTVRKDESASAPLYAVVSSHVQTEQWIKESGIAYTLLRHNLYAEVIPMFLGTKEQILQSKAVYLPTGNGKAAFAPRKDLAEAAAIILSNSKGHEHKTYEFNGSEEITFEQVAVILSDVLGEQINYVSPEIKAFESTLTSFGLPAEVVATVSSFSQGIANGEFDQQHNDLENILGRKTQAIAEFLSEVYA